MQKQSECQCSCHTTPGMVHVMACCYPDKPWMFFGPSISQVYVQMSHAGRVVAIYTYVPTRTECDASYAKYLGQPVEDRISSFNTWIECWQMNEHSEPQVVEPIENIPNTP